MSVKIFGQDNILKELNELTLDTLPHSILIEGESGSGKHLITSYIKDKFDLELIDITDIISNEVITRILLNPNPTFYLINGTALTDKKENTLLKLIEEPTKNCYIIILCENLQQLLPTVVNRCRIIKLNKYYSNQLKENLNLNIDDRIYELADTPGQVLKFKDQNIENIISLCETMINRIHSANYSNVLSITNKIALENESDKINLDCYIKCMQYLIIQKLKNIDIIEKTSYNNLINIYQLTKELSNSRYIHNINMKYAFDKYLTNLKIILQ